MLKIRKMGEIFAVGITAFLLFALTTWQSYQKYVSDGIAESERIKAENERQKADQARTDANLSQAKSIQYLEQLEVKNAEIQTLQQFNISRSEKIISDVNETFRHVTGHGVAEIKVNGSKTENYIIRLFNNSYYPLYDLQIEQISLTELVKYPLVKVSELNYFDASVVESLVSPYVADITIPAKKNLYLPIKLQKTTDVNFVLYIIQARHATFFQYCSVQNFPERNMIHYRYITFQLIDGNFIEVGSNMTNVGKMLFENQCPFYRQDLLTWETE